MQLLSSQREKTMRRQLLVVLLVVFIVFPTQAQKYRKKVVSFVDKVLVPSGVQLSTDQTDFIKKAVAKNVSLARFNYAPLPDTVAASFSVEASTLTKFTPDDVKPILDRTLAPQLLQILDVSKELLSRQNLSEADKNTFLAMKAKAAGLSANQLQSILNSGYFYIPFVEQYRHTEKKDVREEKDSKGKVTKKVPFTKYTHELQLGILWYKLNVDQANKVSVAFVGRAQGWNTGPIERSKEKDDDKKGNPDGEAFEDAVNVSTKNIGLETKRMETFSLTGGVTETTATGLRLSIGNREGVGLDDIYWIEEMEETETGQIIKTRRGFVKIRDIGNNKNDESATSYAQVITGTNYSSGLGATELPLIGINGVLAFAVFPASITEFNSNLARPPMNLLGTSNYDFGLRINSKNSNAYGLMGSIQMSLANSTRISEFWALIGINAGLSNVDGQLFIKKFNSNKTIADTNSVDIGSSWTGSIHAGLLKKFYFRRYGFLLQADVKYALFRMSGKGKDETNSNDVTYMLTNGALGFDVRAGMEVYFTPWFSMGAAAEYNIYGISNSWSAAVDDKDSNELFKKKDAIGPDIKYSGIGVSVWLNFAIPSFY
jgi:hypothetical protein